MSKIRILPEQLANRIAAGEVVERPASVVKELMENSLDAGADRIEIEIEGGGTRLIRVVDNGEGMDEDDVLLCLERHGTSKMHEDDDLSAIRSLGFRGEAIPSIASVSRMTLTSRLRQSELGTCVVCHFGSVKQVHESGARTGTAIEVANLFGNTPARRKFLRTARTELSHIDDTVRSYGLARPDVAFVLRIDGRETVRLDHGTDLPGRLRLLCNYHGDFISLHASPTGPDRITISGLLVPPEAAVAVAGRLRLFVNGRSVRDRMLGHAVSEGLRSFLLKGRSPAGFVRVDLPPESVDVNVHPAKHEVRFQDSRTVHQLVCDTVREAMQREQQRVRQEVFAGRRSEAVRPAPTAGPSAGAAAPLSDAAEPEDRAAPVSHSHPRPPGQASRAGKHAPLSPQPLFETRERLPPLPPAAAGRADDPGFFDGAAAPVAVDDLIVIGSFRNLYIFCRNRERLVVIDQHAAHERLLFEDLRRQYTGGRIVRQSLLFPVTIELSPFQARLVEKHLEQLEQMGFELRPFGGASWIIGALPALAGTSDPQGLFLDVLEQFGSERNRPGGDRINEILAAMACKAAVKAGDHLSELEIRALLERMAAADLFSHCPHGRPVVKTFSSAEISRWFQRT